MPSFRTSTKPSRRAAARFVTGVRRKILKALEEEQKKRGLKQTDLARAIEVHRSVINRELRGKKDITLGRVAELAWAMDRVAVLDLAELAIRSGSNLPPLTSSSASNSPTRNLSVTSTSVPSAVPANNNFSPVALSQAN
jgi:hypothetical protein